MSSKAFNILKAAFFILLAVGLIAYQFRNAGKSDSHWPWVGVIICVIAAVGYLKQAFNK